MFQFTKRSFFLSATYALIQLFSAIDFAKGSEMPLELMQGGSVNANGDKSMAYARRIALLLAANDDNDIEMPPHVEDNLDLNSAAAITRDDLVEKEHRVGGGGGGMPKWLQMQLETDNHITNMMHKQSSNKQQQQRLHHADIRQAGKSCSIQVTKQITGTCQMMPVGNVCISGEYLDAINADCS